MSVPGPVRVGSCREDRPGEGWSRVRRGGGTMARGERKADQRARIGLERLEGRNLQSALAGGAAASAPLVRPTTAIASAYHTTVWGGSVEQIGPVKGGSATIVHTSLKATPILF